jgi:hypothetical protein
LTGEIANAPGRLFEDAGWTNMIPLFHLGSTSQLPVFSTPKYIPHQAMSSSPAIPESVLVRQNGQRPGRDHKTVSIFRAKSLFVGHSFS